MDGVCSCVLGFELADDGRKCLPTSLPSIFPLYPDLPPTPLAMQSGTVPSVFSVITTPTIAMDYHQALQKVVYVDQNGKTLLVVPAAAAKTRSTRTPVLPSDRVLNPGGGSGRVESLAVDWVSDNVYWTEPEQSHYEILFGGQFHVSSLTLDRTMGVIYWYDPNFAAVFRSSPTQQQSGQFDTVVRDVRPVPIPHTLISLRFRPVHKMQFFGGKLYLTSGLKLLTVDVMDGIVTHLIELTREPMSLGIFQEDIQKIHGMFYQ
eukprot:sb/3468418/